MDKYEACLLFLQPKELFIEFDPEPLGTASLAQVHRARLKDGREVAVKVQHPTVKSHSKIDMKGMEVTHDLLYYITVLYYILYFDIDFQIYLQNHDWFWSRFTIQFITTSHADAS